MRLATITKGQHKGRNVSVDDINDSWAKCSTGESDKHPISEDIVLPLAHLRFWLPVKSIDTGTGEFELADHPF